MSDEDEDKLSKAQRRILAEMQAMRGKGASVQVEHDVRVKNPGKGRKADYEGSRAHAIDLNCYSCMGGAKNDVKDCRSYSCAFWIFRPGATSTVRPPGAVPTLSQYAELLDAKTTEAQRATARANAERLRKPSADASEQNEDADDE